MEKNNENEIVIQIEELINQFSEKIKTPVTPTTTVWNEKTMVDFIDNMTVLCLNIITLLSRKMTNNKINMIFNLEISVKVASIINNKSFNKDREGYDLLLSLCMEEGHLLITTLLDTMKEMQKLQIHCFKDEIKILEYYLKDEWSFYKNPKKEVTTK